ncbi:hypothetical protein K440DRAFT_10245 [Wilcoxina mikolae CBS 423.85]|nr:hypothetical protein K440DRAFT_10245 [Wilcoxina mikolae CBS 423.85]
MSDADLDLEFEATNKSLRPQSQLARAFADQLNDVFLLDETLDKLDRNINRKKQSVSYQSSELALLEARIKHAEKLLEEKKAHLLRGGDAVANGNIPDYAANPNFSATPDADKKREGGDVVEEEEVDQVETRPEREYVVVDRVQEKQQYQVRPPPPPPSVPATM